MLKLDLLFLFSIFSCFAVTSQFARPQCDDSGVFSDEDDDDDDHRYDHRYHNYPPRRQWQPYRPPYYPPYPPQYAPPLWPPQYAPPPYPPPYPPQYPPPPPPPQTPVKSDPCPDNYASSVIPSANSCPAGWQPFMRRKGVVCLKTFSSGAITRDSAEAICGQNQATLAGIENRAERLWINAQFLPLLPPVFRESKTIWVGARRKTQCLPLNNNPPSCYPAQTQMFYWTDPSVTGTDGFCPWWPHNPSNGGGLVPLQGYLMFTIQEETDQHNGYGSRPGILDDVDNNGYGTNIFGLVCSKYGTN